jgi:hypothetical protein
MFYFSATDGLYTVNSGVLTINLNDVNEAPVFSQASVSVDIVSGTTACE